MFEIRPFVKPLPDNVPEFDHGPPAVQLDALVEDQVSVDCPPNATEVGDAESVAEGAGADPTPSVTDWIGVVPPGPVHWNVKVVFAVRGFAKPLPERVPEFVQGPPAVQLVALVELQVIVGRPLYVVGFGEIERVAVGVGCTATQVDLYPQRVCAPEVSVEYTAAPEFCTH